MKCPVYQETLDIMGQNDNIICYLKLATWLSSTICRELSRGLRPILVGQWSSTLSAYNIDKIIITIINQTPTLFSGKVYSEFFSVHRELTLIVKPKWTMKYQNVYQTASYGPLWGLLCWFLLLLYIHTDLPSKMFHSSQEWDVLLENEPQSKYQSFRSDEQFWYFSRHWYKHYGQHWQQFPWGMPVWPV